MKGLFSFVAVFVALLFGACAPSRFVGSYSGYYHTNWSSEGHVLTNKLEVIEKTGGGWDDNNRIYGKGFILEIDLEDPVTENILLTHTVGNYANSPSKVWESVTAMDAWHHDGDAYFVYKSYDYNNSRSGTTIRFYKNGDLIKSVQEDMVFGESTIAQLRFDKLNYNPKSNYLLLSVEYKKFKVFDPEGNTLREVNLGGGAIWKEPGVILFYHDVEQKLAEYRMDTEEVIVYPVSFVPEWYSATENAVYMLDGLDYKKCNLLTDEVILIKRLEFDNDVYRFHDFSKDGSRLLLFPYPQSFDSSTSTPDGISVYNLETDELTKLRD